MSEDAPSPSSLVAKDNEGLRYNNGKPRYDLIHPVAERGLVDVLTKALDKYPEFNWERGMNWRTVIASLKRHLAAFEMGEEYDEESGLLHIDHVQANAHFLSTYQHLGEGIDDRRKL